MDNNLIDLDVLQQIIDRALLLNVEGYVDNTKVLSFRKSQLCLNLDNFLEYLDTSNLERINNKYLIELPDRFHAIFMGSNISAYVNQAYYIIFPQNVYYVGDENSMQYNVIGFNEKFYIHDALKDCTLDFMKCKRLNKLLSLGFANMTIDEVLFGPGIYFVYSHAFKEAIINKVKFTNLREVKDSAFLHAHFHEVDFGCELVEVGYKSFCFDEEVNEVILCAYDDNFRYTTFKNVKNIYLPYTLYGEAEEVESILDEIKDDIHNKKYSYKELYEKLKDVVEYMKLKREGQKISTEIMDILYDICVKNKTGLKGELAVKCLDMLVAIYDVNIYFYSDEYYARSYDVHDREYEELASENFSTSFGKKTVKVFIEEY